MILRFTFLKKILLGIVLSSSLIASAQSDGDYQFNYTDTGDDSVDWNWNDAANWQVYSSGWIAATNYPGEVAGAGTVNVNDGEHIILSADISEAVGALTFADGTTTATDLMLSGYDLTVTGAVTFNNPDGDVEFYEQAIVVDGSTLACGSVEMVNTDDNGEDTRIYVIGGTLIVNGDINQANSNRNGIWFRTFESSSSSASGDLYIEGDYNGNGFNRGTSTVYYNSTGEQIVGNIYYYNVELTGGTKTLRGNTYIYDSGVLTLGTILDVNTRQLYFRNAASFTDESGGADFDATNMFTVSDGGSIYRYADSDSDLNITYPFGIDSEYTPVIISNLSSSDYNGYVLIRMYDSQNSFTDGSDNALTRYWNISSDLTISTADITFTYADDDAASPITETNLTTVGYWDGNDWNVWTDADTEATVDYTNNQFSITGQANIAGDWSLGEASGCFDGTSYTGTVSITAGNWNTAATWNTGSVPASDEDVTIAHYVTSNVDATVNSLTIADGGTLNLNNKIITVTNDVNVAGNLRDSNGTGNFEVNGNLIINDGGDFDQERGVITVDGDVTVESGGYMDDTNTNGSATFNGKLSIASGGTYHMQNGDVSIVGVTDVYGTLYDTDPDGTNTFSDKLTVYSGGDFNSDETGHVFPSEIENNGSFVISSAYEFTTDITFSGTSAIQFTNSANFVVDNNITITNQNSGGFEIPGDMVVNSGSTLYLDDNSVLRLGDTNSLTNNGVLKVVGSLGNMATITTSGSGGYTINQTDASAELHALYATFDATGGISISDGTIDDTNDFDYCSFTNGTGTEYLEITDFDPADGFSNIQSVAFGTGPTYNVTRTSGTNTVAFVEATGDLSGENYDNDDDNPGTLISWSNPSSTYYSTGDVSAYATASWNSAEDGSGSSPSLSELADGSLALVVQDGHTVTLDNNGDVDVRELYVGEGTSGSFLIGEDGTERTLVVQELLQVEDGATLQSASDGVTHYLQLYGNLVNNGIFDLHQSYTSLVEAEVYGEMIISGTVSPIFSTITFEDGCDATANIALDVDWNLILESGAVFNDGGYTHTIEYNWTNNGGVYNATGGLVFDGGTCSITASGTSTTFNDVSFTGGAVVTIKQGVVFDGDVLIDNDTKVSVDDVTVYFNGDYTIESGSEYEQTSNYSRFDGTDAQTITLNGTASFNRIYFTNGDANAKTVVGDLNVDEWLMINSGATVAGSGDHSIQSGLRVDGICDFAGTITMNGGYVDTNDAAVNAFTLGTAELIVEGTVYLRHNVTSEVVSITMQNDVTVNSGSLVISDDAVFVGQSGNVITLAESTNLYIRGADNFPDGFGTYDFDETANVRYDAGIDQTVRGGFTYGRLYLNNRNADGETTKTVDGSVIITGYLYLYNDVTLNLGSYSHEFSGSYIYNSTSHNGSIDGSNAIFTIGGTDANQTLQSNGTGIYTFGNLTLSQTDATATRTQTFDTGCNIEVTGDLTIENNNGTEAIQHIVNLNDNAISGSGSTLSVGEYCKLYVDHLDFGTDVIDNFTTTSFDVNSTVDYSLDGGSPTSTSNPIDTDKNQTIADGVTYGNLVFYNGNKIADGSLDIDGDLSSDGACVFYDGGYTHALAGDWQLYSTDYYTEGSASGTIYFDGVDQNVNGYNFNNITIANSGTVSLFNTMYVYGDLIVNDGSAFEASTLSIYVGGDITVNGAGVYTQTTGYTTLDGDGNQNITLSSGSNFGYLTLNKTTPATQTVTALSDVTVAYSFRLTEHAGIFDFSNQQLSVGDDLYIRNNRIDDVSTQNFIATGSTLSLNGSTAQYIYLYHENDVVLNNLIFEGTGDKTLSHNDPSDGYEESDTLDINGNVTIDGSEVSGYNVNMRVAGDWANSGTFSSSRTVYFDGADQDVSSTSFYYVNFQGSGTKTLGGNITVERDLYIAGTATLDADGNDITLGRHWYNNVDGAGYTHGNGKVVFNGSNASYLYSGTEVGSVSGKDFYDLDINKSSNYVTLYGDLVVENDLNIESEILYTSSYDVLVGGDFDVSGTYNNNNNESTLTLNASDGGSHIFNPNDATLRGLIIDASGATYEMQSDFILDNEDMTLTAGTLNVNENQIQLIDNGRSIDIDGGTLNIGAGSEVLFTNTQSINLNSGELYFVGEDGNNAQLSNSDEDDPFSVNADGGTLYANYYKVQKGQITVTGATLDATNNLSNGTFVEGDAGTSYITLTSVDLATDTISLSDMIFNSGADYNISRTSGSGVVNVLDASGGLAGESYEEDSSTESLIEWTFPDGFFWDAGSATDSEDWHQSDNWSGNTVPGSDDIVYLDHTDVVGAYDVNVDADASCSRLNITDGSGSSAITFTLGSGVALDVTEHVVIGDNTSLIQADNTSLLTVGENWTNQGTYTPNGSSVTFNAASGSYIISSGGAGTGNSFYDLIFDAGESTYALDLPIDIENNLTITSGTLDLSSSSNDLTIDGDWYIDQSNGGDFEANGADVTFGGTTQSLTNGTFYNLIIDGTSTTTLVSNIAVENDLTLNDGSTLDAGDNNIYVRGDWVNDNGTLTQTDLGTVIFDATSTQYIDNGSYGTTFNNLTFSNSGGKYLMKDISVNGDILINDGAGVVDVNTFQITGDGDENEFTCNEDLQIEGANNFPVGFETIDFSDESLVRYYADMDQTIYATTYGSLSLRRATDDSTTPYVKTAAGDLEITTNLYLNSDNRPAELDMETNDANITLTGTIYLNSTSAITWGTDSATLEHVGSGWYIDEDITSFNNLILNGTGDKYTQGDLTITGDLTIKSDVDLFMYTSSGRDYYKTITGTSGKTISMETGARIRNSRPSTDGVAIPEGFGIYDFNENSIYEIYANSIDQTVYTDIEYGNLYFYTTKDVTGDGVANLNVNGNLNTNNSTYYDGGTDVEVGGSSVIFNRYVASSDDRALVLDGLRDQSLISDGDDDDNTLNLASVEFTGTGTKTISDITEVSGDWLIDTDVIVKTGYNITCSGSTWTNNGYYQQTGNTLTFDGTSDQTIDPGTYDESNYFYYIEFSGSSTKTFENNGANINQDMTIDVGTTVDLSDEEYYLYDELYNSGTLISSGADLILDGGSQEIQSADFAIENITCSGTGTKYLYSDWTIGNDLVIESGVTLDTRDNTDNDYYNINIGGDWTNEGTFNDRDNCKVTFDGSLSPVVITSGGSNFYDVEFVPTSSVTYNLLSESTTFYNQMDIGTNATLDLNGKELYLGRNNTSTEVTHTVNGTLTIDENAIFYINNDDVQTTLDVYGTFNVVGASSTEVATLSSETMATNRDKTIVNINSGATFGARYYLIEYISDDGLNLMAGSTLDATNNFSDGTFLGLRDQQDARYITLESNYSGDTISSVSFSYDDTPEVGKHYNVQRENASGNIVFKDVSGALGTYRYEDDDESTPAHDGGKLRWPEITESNWTGAVSTDWHDEDNWDNGVPTSTIDAIIGLQDNMAIVFSEDAVCKSLNVTDGTLRLEEGMDIVVNSDVTVEEGVFYVNSSESEITVNGDWTVSESATFYHGDGTINFVSSSGSANIAPGTSSLYDVIFNNSLTTFNITDSEMDIEGNLAIYNGTVSPSSSNYTYNLHGDYLITDGYFDVSTSGVIVLIGDADQTVTNGVFYNVQVDGSGTKMFEETISIEGTTQVNSTMAAQTDCDITFNDDVTIDVGGTFNDGDESHEFAGQNWYGDGTYTGDGTITFNRSEGYQYVYGSTFNNLIIDCQGQRLYLEEDVTINGDLTFNEGISYVNLQTSTFTSDGTGIFTVESGVSVYVYGTDNFPKAFASYDLDEASSTLYYSSSAQNIDGVSYGIVVLDNASTKTLTGDTEVKGNLYFNESTIDVSVNNYSLTIGGHWYNHTTTSPGSFICQEGEVIFNGDADQNIYFYDANDNDFYDLTIAGSGEVNAVNSTNNPFVVLDDLTVSSGVFDASGRIIYVAGDLVASGAGTFNSSGEYYLNQSSGTANIGVNGSTLYNLTINSGATYTAADDIDLSGSFTLTAGTFDGNGMQVDLGNGSSDIVTIDGTYLVGSGGVLGLGSGTSCTVSSTGRIEVVGSEYGLAKVTNNDSDGRYSFTVNGEIAAEYYQFEYMSSTGIYLSSTSTIDATYHFSNGTFSNGTTTGQLFRVENTQTFTEADGGYIENVSFPVNPGGSANNVAKYTATSGDLEFYNSTGVFAGESYDNDTEDLIEWTGPISLTWNGDDGTDWNTTTNWTASSGSGFVPTADNNVIIPGSLVNYPKLIIGGQITGNLSVESGAEIRISTSVGDFEADLDVDGDLTLEGSLSTSSVEDSITVEGNWTAESGSVISLEGNVTFDGVGGAKQIDNNGEEFYSLTISGSTEYQIAEDTEIENDLIINSGATLGANSSDYDITIGGDWQNDGTFNAQEGMVLFGASSGSPSISVGSSSFYDVQIDASGVTYTLTEDMVVEEELEISDGTLDVDIYTLSIGDGSGTDGASISGTLLINAGATLDMGDGASLNVNSGGSMELLGDDDDNRAVLTSSSEGRYSFDVNSGGSIKAQYYSVDYIDADGLYMQSGADIDETNNLSDGVFSNGAPGGSYMTLLHEMTDATFTLSNLVFNSGPDYSVTRTEGTTVYYFEDAIGDLGNYLYEHDDEDVASPSSGLLQWPFVYLYTWEGTVSNDWLTASNWFEDQLPVSTADITIPATANDPVIDDSQLCEMNGLEIKTGATVTINAGATVTLTGDLTVEGSLIVDNTIDAPVSIMVDGTVTGDANYNWPLTNMVWWYIAHPVTGVTEAEYEASYGADEYALNIYNAAWERIAGINEIYSAGVYPFDEPLEGYSLVFKNADEVLTYSGTLNTGGYSKSDYSIGLHLVANPYPSYIDVSDAGFDFGNFGQTVYIRKSDNKVSTYSLGTGLGLEEGSKYIAPGQCMWLRTYTGNDAISIDNSARVHGAGSLKGSSSVDDDVLRLSIQSDFDNDETVVLFREIGSELFASYDSEKILNTGTNANLYTIKDENIIAINALPELTSSTVVLLGYQVSASGLSDFEIEVSDIDDFMPRVSVYLVDKEADVTINLREESSYAFTPSVTEDNDRFELRFEPITTDIDEETVDLSESNVMIYAINQKAIVKVSETVLLSEDREIQVYNLSGQLLSTYELNSLETEFDLEQNNMLYIIRVSVGSASYKEKVISLKSVR